MKKIEVLLSTYNGELYLRKQLDSLLLQENVDVEILVRDDGSNDGTKEILKEYEEHNLNIEVVWGRNVGPAKSFMLLMQQAREADYYAFCDQDDIWDCDKLSVAVNVMKDKDNNRPQLYYSNARLIDEDDIVFSERWHSEIQCSRTKYAALLENRATGCTMVFNKATLEMIDNNRLEYCYMHDWYVYMVCVFFGEAIYDDGPHMSYRQHKNNVIGAKKMVWWKRIATSINNFFNGDNVRYENAKAFYLAYKGRFLIEDKSKIEKIVFYNKTFVKRIKLCIDNDYFDGGKFRDIKNRLLIIMGRL